MPPLESAAKRLAWSAFVVRMFAAIAIYLFVPTESLAPDAVTFDSRAQALSQYWRGEIAIDPSLRYLGGRDSTPGFYYILAAIYFPFGHLPLVALALNAWIGSRAVLELYKVTRLIGGSETAGLRAARLLAYFPSQILWSSMLIRDVWVQWLLLRLAREMAELKGQLIPSRLISAAFLIWGLTQFRSYLLYAAVGPFVLSFLLGRTKDLIRNLLLGSVFAIALAYVGARGAPGGEVRTLDLEELNRLRQWSSSSVAADSGFATDADISTVGGALTFLPVGLTYFFFAPFPWQIGSPRQALAVPETAYFYILFPAILTGIGYLVRKRLTESVGVLLVTMTVTFGYAIGQGNVGSLYRHKAQVIGFYYAFAAVGLELRKRQTQAPLYPAGPRLPDPRIPANQAAAYSGPARLS